MKTISASLECGVGIFGLSLISTSLPIPGRRWRPGNHRELEAGWVRAWVVRCGSRSTVWSHQPQAFSPNPSWLWWMGGFSGTGQDCAHTWSWQKNRELFFVEQLELKRGGENVPMRSPSNRAASAGWEAAGMLARISAGSTVGATVPFLLGFAKSGSVSQPLTLFPPSSAPPGSSLGLMLLQREASSG